MGRTNREHRELSFGKHPTNLSCNLCRNYSSQCGHHPLSVLKREGYEIAEANNGKEAFDKIKIERPDLVLSDIRMPIWDGYQLMKELAALPPPPLPILFMSGYIGQDEIQVQKEPNVVGFM